MEAHIDESKRHSLIARPLGNLPLAASSVAFYPYQGKKNFDRLSLKCLSLLGILIVVFKIYVKFASVKFYDTRIVEK